MIIENKDALAVMRAHDAETTLYYIDPPYVPETRVQGNRYYAHEMTVFYNTNFGRDDFRTILAETVLKRASVIPLRFMVIHLYVLV
ncbi:DNA adenine methylase [Klebsiella pneumoniae]